jgi:hypothetical protein
LQPETLREMWRQQNVGVPLDLDTRVGITWFLEDLPHPQGLFKTELQGTPLWLIFDRIGTHDVILTPQGPEPTLLWSGRQCLGERITPSELTESWKSRLGQYSVPRGAPREFFEKARLSQGEGVLLLERSSAMLGEASTLVLKPEGEERAIVLGLGRGKGEVVRFERQGEARFLYTKGIRLQLTPPEESH